MNPELALWDQISLGIALLIVVVFIGLRIKQALSPSSGGCGGCSCGSAGGSCSIRPAESEQNVQTVSVDEIQKNVIVK